MQVCTSLQTDNHASTPPICFLQAGCPSCRPTNSVKALKEKAQGIYNKNRNRLKTQLMTAYFKSTQTSSAVQTGVRELELSLAEFACCEQAIRLDEA